MAKRINNQSIVGDILNQIIKTNKLESGLDQVSVIDAWKNLMGNGVNNYTRSVALRNNILYVELTSSVLREELSYGKDKIIKMINEELGKEVVKDVVLR
jgi:predicted nucleic acid-binding Zn ribbon protein